MSDGRFHLAMIAGSTARAAGRRLSHCPHPEGSSLARCWAYGWRGDERVSRETGRGVGRGRGALGPRSEWTGAELDDLVQLTGDGLPNKTIAKLLDRTCEAVRGQLHRLRRKQAA